MIALLAASDVLEAVLGEEPKAALGLLAVTAGIAALLVGIGPLLLKAIGNDTSVPTVLGVTAAGSVVLAGSIAQISALTFQARELTEESVLDVGIFAGELLLPPL